MKKVVSKRYGQDWELIILNGLGESQKKKQKKHIKPHHRHKQMGKKKKKTHLKFKLL